ncbi:hypothetical protein DID88_000105 [Monilinia fructigena]|uniref:Reverse transcriptase domain-containing protein n=1 Tax=Monilinia fructigena TaxID=38457 RepID=A0A395IPQ0_9HELO|nr:hypothetical protein DID88_000105 [Monilinia fructigena]
MPGKEPPYFKNRPLSSLELEVVPAKPGGGVRICQDYRGLNNVTIKNRYPLPIVRETLDLFCNATVYTKLDIIAAVNKLVLQKVMNGRQLLFTRFGLFESLVMPFGLCNAPASFQHYINHTLFNELDKYCTAYLDDVLVYSATKIGAQRACSNHSTKVGRCWTTDDINKCEFETVSTRYLGLIITTNGIQMDPEKVTAITSWEQPLSVKRSTTLLGAGLAYFDHNKRRPGNGRFRLGIRKDTFSYDSDGLLRPVAYFSAKHSAAECNYEIYDKELLAIIKSMEEWRPELQGSQQEFEILTDHKNLEYFTTTKALNHEKSADALSRKRDRPNFATGDDERLKNRERIVLPADKFDIDLYNELKAGIHLAPTDLVVPAEDKPIDELIDDAYRRSDMAHQLIAAIEDHHVRKWPVEFRKTLRVAMQDCYVANNRIYYRERLWIPPDDELKVQIIYRMHSSGPAGHPGRTKTIDLVSRTYWWPQMHQENCFIRASMRALYAHKVIKVGPTRIPTPITSPLSSLV